MPTILTAMPDRGMLLENTLGDARIGRWCHPPEVPDRCYCRDEITMLNLPARGFVFDEVYNLGVCYGCYKKYLPGGVWQGIARGIVLEIPV